MSTKLVLSAKPAQRRVQLLHELCLLDESEEERAEREEVEAAVKVAEDAARRANLVRGRAAREVARKERAGKRAAHEEEYAEHSRRRREWMEANKKKEKRRMILPPTFVKAKPAPMSYAEWKLLKDAQDKVAAGFILDVPVYQYDSDGTLIEE